MGLDARLDHVVSDIEALSIAESLDGVEDSRVEAPSGEPMCLQRRIEEPDGVGVDLDGPPSVAVQP